MSEYPLWTWKHFNDLSAQELYDIIALREQVFVVEQKCIYLDADGLDPQSWHLCGYLPSEDQRPKLVAYLRVVLPGFKYGEHSIGRVVTASEVRKMGYGKLLTAEALKNIEKTFGNVPIRISAQLYLKNFYSSFGFKPVGEPYDEDGIPHIEMSLI